ncbi:MAG: hypothetical protein GXO25_01960 [Euryarchaeota archaeon]|nr:hypothetical protein [Euryarchaeota archaeon]
MGFIDAGVYVYPRGAGVLQYRKIVAYNSIIPFFVVGASLLLYFRIGKLVIYAMSSAFDSSVAFAGFIAYTIGYFILVIFTLIFTTFSVSVEFLPDNTVEITYGGKKYRAKRDEIRLITGDALSAFGFRVKDNMLLIVTEQWQVKVSVFFTRKAYMKFYSYLYYRLYPDEYLKSNG